MGEWYSGSSWGENIACMSGCPADAGEAIDLWIHSPGHNANLLNPSWNVTGVGVTCNETVQMMVVHYRS
jgi:uncharacterized protein YkwD